MYILKSQKYYSEDNYIEVIGMPASGKSTSVREMIDKYPSAVNVNERLPKGNLKRQMKKFLYIFFLFLKSPKVFVKDTKIVISSEQRSFKDLYAVLSNWHLIVYQSTYYRKSMNSKYIWDQGLFQAIWSIYYSGLKDFDYLELMVNKRLPLKIYFTDADDKELIRRANARGTNIRLNYNNKDDIERGRYALDKTIQTIKHIGYTEMYL